MAHRKGYNVFYYFHSQGKSDCGLTKKNWSTDCNEFDDREIEADLLMACDVCLC